MNLMKITASGTSYGCEFHTMHCKKKLFLLCDLNCPLFCISLQPEANRTFSVLNHNSCSICETIVLCGLQFNFKSPSLTKNQCLILISDHCYQMVFLYKVQCKVGQLSSLIPVDKRVKQVCIF